MQQHWYRPTWFGSDMVAGGRRKWHSIAIRARKQLRGRRPTCSRERACRSGSRRGESLASGRTRLRCAGGSSDVLCQARADGCGSARPRSQARLRRCADRPGASRHRTPLSAIRRRMWPGAAANSARAVLTSLALPRVRTHSGYCVHDPNRGTAGGRPPRGVRHPAHAAHGRALARRALGVRSGHHGAQSVQQMVPARLSSGPTGSCWWSRTTAPAL